MKAAKKTIAKKSRTAVKRKAVPAARKRAAAAPKIVPITIKVQLNDPDWPLKVTPFVAQVNDGEKTLEWKILTPGWQFETKAIEIHPDWKQEFPEPPVHHQGRTRVTLLTKNRRVEYFNYTIYLVHKKSGTRLSLDPGISDTDHTSSH
ncbi:MAG: hypothetical protein ING59_14265 [Burkholderiales bacterium]|jgi:hypothetical protein|nr:hypothetical protein [Burkholderiales bacterium]